MNNLSDLATQWLSFFVTNPDFRINHRNLMSKGVSRRKSYAIIRELCDHNYLKITKHPVFGTSIKVVVSDATTVVASVTYGTAVTLVSSNSVSYTAVTTDKVTNKFFDGVEEEGKDMGWDFWESSSSGESDDVLDARRKQAAYKAKEYEKAREAKAQQRKDLHRSKLDPANWTCKDVAYEFADRMANIWSIKPFSVTQSRFVQALSGFRKQQGTNGAIELEIIDLFFRSLQHDKYTDGNHLWRAFLYKAPALLQQARESVVTVEERETAIIKDQELTSRKLALFDEDDDV